MPLDFASCFTVQTARGCECGAINYTKSKNIPGRRKKIEWNRSIEVRRSMEVEEKTMMLYILSATKVEMSSFSYHKRGAYRHIF